MLFDKRWAGSLVVYDFSELDEVQRDLIQLEKAIGRCGVLLAEMQAKADNKALPMWQRQEAIACAMELNARITRSYEKRCRMLQFLAEIDAEIREHCDMLAVDVDC